MSDLFAQPCTSTLVIGVGRAGSRVAAAGALQGGECGSASWAALHIDAAELLATGLTRKVLLRLPQTDLVEAAIIAELQNAGAEIERLAAGYSAIVLAGSAADCGAMLLPALAGVLEKLAPQASVIAIAAESLALDQAAPRGEFSGLLDELRGTCDLVIPLSASVLGCCVKPDAPLSGVDAVLDRKLLAVAQALTSAMMRDEHNARFTLTGLRNVLRHGVSSVGLGIALGGNAPLLAAASAARRLAADGERHSGLAVALVCGRVLSVVEAQGLLEVLKSELKAEQPVLLGLATEESLDDEALCLILASAPSSANVISLAAR
jgi:cell division GTPase FtsZ